MWGRVPDETRRLEHKGEADVWFGAAGYDVAAQRARVRDGSGARLDRGLGTVWAGVDRSLKPAGNARLVRWVRDPSDEAAVRAFFGDAGIDEVRISPFVEGVPFGVNALVFDDGVAVGPVVEMLTLRHGTRLRTFGMATYWQPSEADRQAIRTLVRRVGAVLGGHLGYRGGFTVDGVLGEDGPVPTEINARCGGAVHQQEQHNPDLCIGWMSRLLREGHPPEVSAHAYEALWNSSLDQVSGGYGGLQVGAPWQGDRQWNARWVQGTLALQDGPPDLVLWAHAMQPGGFVRVVPEPSATPRGPSVAPVVVAGLGLASTVLGVPFDDWQPARDVRR